MQSQSISFLRLGALAAALAAAFSLAACDQPASPTVGQRTDGAIAEARQGSADAANSVKNAAVDATITTKINAALAADDRLSAMKIDVDTAGGRVTLKGTAPDAAARERATTLASGVEGVLAVDNQLALKGS